MDSDGDGKVSASEFESYCRKTEIALGAERVNELFRLIQRNGNSDLHFEDFVSYFKNEPSAPQYDITEDTLDSIKTIEEYIVVANAAGTNVCNETLKIIAEGLRENDLRETINKLLSEGSALPVSLSEPGERRWRPFDEFQRRVKGQAVLTAPAGIVKDLLPGTYSASELAQHPQLSKELGRPRRTEVEAVRWEEGQWLEVEGRKTWTRHSRLIFPDTFDGVVETDVRS